MAGRKILIGISIISWMLCRLCAEPSSGCTASLIPSYKWFIDLRRAPQYFGGISSAPLNFMANLDNPQITIDSPDNDPSFALAFPSPSLDSSHSDSERRSPSPSTDNHGHLSCPTPILWSAPYSLDAFGSSSHASDSPHPPQPSPTPSSSIRSVANSIVSSDNNQAHSLYLVPPDRKHDNGSTESDSTSLVGSVYCTPFTPT
jgi:hypothetical protein